MKLREVFLIVVLITLSLSGSSSFAQEYEDVVYLNNGGVRRGMIIEQVPGESLKLKTNYGEVVVIKMSEISKLAQVPYSKIDRETSKSVFGWDGERQGFLWGFGAGAQSQSAYYAGVKSTEIESIGITRAVTISKIGYAPNNTFALLLHSYSLSDEDAYYALTIQKWSNPEPQSNSWFGGFGLISHTQNIKLKGVDQSDGSIGVGVHFGYGREIADHASIETSITIGFVDTDRNISHLFRNEQIIAGSSISFQLLGY